jgi:hypothetical protein
VTDSDEVLLRDGITALRRVASLIRHNPHLVETARTPLVLRDFEGLAHRLEEPRRWEWDLGKEFAFLSAQDIGAVTEAMELLVALDAGEDHQQVRRSLVSLEDFLRRFLNCWT